VLPQLRRLERKYAADVAVVGVHSPKFTSERDTESVRQAILRLNVGHPVLNDHDFQVWQQYAVRAWPTLMFIDPQGKVIGKHEGELPLESFDRLLGEMVQEFDAAGMLDRRALQIAADAAAPETPLRFPGKVLADERSGRLFVSDTGHNRLVIADLDGAVRRVVGAGGEGREDGPAGRATFAQPQGLALVDGQLYVADTGNHLIRVVDLASGEVRTVAGTGVQLTGARVGGIADRIALASPWDLAVAGDVLYVAMAGTHQLWAMPLGSGVIAPHTGNAREALIDGPLTEASMNQPSGLTGADDVLYVADSEASAVREVDLRRGVIRTIVGEGLFEFGDLDGIGAAAVRLQHPLGVVAHAGVIYIADTYNHKIKRLDPSTAECRTLLGDGIAGRRDGVGPAARFSEPSGVSVARHRLYVADTNNHAIRVAELATARVVTLDLLGLAPPDPDPTAGAPHRKR
jgi:DNA-binding beta-propeller fold protein YncE